MDPVATALERLVLTRDLGYSGIRETARTEGLERIGRGVYLKADPDWKDWERARVVNAARTIAAVRCDDTVRACLTSAVVLLQLPIWQTPTTVDLLVGRKAWRKSVKLPGVVVEENGAERMQRHGYAVEERDHDVVEGIPTIGLTRLAVDVALHWHPRDALVVVDGIMARLAEPNRDDRARTEARAAKVRTEIAERLAALPRQRGLRRARAVIAAASPWSESPGESVTRWAGLAMGLPEPMCQYRFRRANGRSYFLDLFWEDHEAGAEFDGKVKYQGDRASEVVVAEKNRDDEIRSTGIRLLHLDTSTANRPRSLAASLRGLLPQEVWRNARPRPGLWTPELGRWQAD